MKNFLSIPVLFTSIIMCFNSCETDEYQRSPTIIKKIKPVFPTGPAYIIPPCLAELELDTLNSNTLNFFAIFTTANKTYVESDEDLTAIIINSNNDKIELKLKPFIRGQSTVYNIVNALSIKNYDCTLNCYINYYSNYVSEKRKITPNPNQNLYVKYMGNNLYELSLCTAASTYFDDFNVKHNTSFRVKFTIEL